MPLTAPEVRATAFTTTRVRAGYDMDEVDAFLDIVEADVAQYADELQRSRDGEAVLRTQCDQIQVRLTIAEQRVGELQDEVAALIAQREAAVTVVAPPEPVVPPEIAEQIAADPEAASVLAIAQRTADEIVRYAQTRADAVRATVRTMLDEQRAMLDRG
jgi:DivIVA domain-containing protein